MQEQHRALIVILILAIALFTFAQRPVADIIGREAYTRRRNLWFGLTVAAFLAPNYWIYLVVASPMLLLAKRHESNLPALYFFILFTLPSATFVIPAGGLFNYLFEVSHARMMALFILLPACFSLFRNRDTLPFGRSGADKALAAYLLLSVALHIRDSTLTDALRQTFYLLLDVLLPYFVMSRSLKGLPMVKDTMLSLVLAIMALALIAVFEFLRDWLLYKPVLDSLELEGGLTGYLGRDGMLRVSASVGHPIALGYLMAVGIGFFLFLQRGLESGYSRRAGMALLAVGLIVPLSRGPWVGVAMLLIVFLATGNSPVRRLIGLALASASVLLLFSLLPGGDRVINLLPYIGTTEKSTVEYRELLFNNSIIAIQQNLWFGSIDFQTSPIMEELRSGGGGIIDVVNSYLGIALEKGIIGLSLFVATFALSINGISRAMRSIADHDSEQYLLGRVLLSTLLAILVIIFTVSSISIIPTVYWAVAGLGVAYAQMVRKQSN